MEDKKLYNAVRKIITLADGRQIEIETGKLAKQAVDLRAAVDFAKVTLCQTQQRREHERRRCTGRIEITILDGRIDIRTSCI